CVVLAGLAGESFAGGVVGRVSLPPAPERPPVARRGFLDRVENQLTPVRPVNVGPHLAVVLEGEARPQAPGQVPWELGGDSFGKPLLVVPVGAEILITNTSGASRTLACAEDPKLVPAGAIAPRATKSFRPTTPGTYTFGDPSVPHLRGKLLVVATPYFAMVEVSSGKPELGTFQLADVAEGSYKLRVFYRDGWIDRPDEPVTVPAGKRNVDVAVKVPPGFPLRK
ncbi:MAG TPA: hypothetical protein VK932_17355, partial [Kofleriaceae bacterium]|nr:hypothetical protein [Kofleriaceae bacterium]